MSERLAPASGSLGQRLASLLGRPTAAAAVAPPTDSTEGAPIDELVRRIRARRADQEAMPSGSPAWSAAVAEERLLTDALRRRATTITPEGLAWLIGPRQVGPPMPVSSVSPTNSEGDLAAPMAPAAPRRAANRQRPKRAAPVAATGAPRQGRQRGVTPGRA